MPKGTNQKLKLHYLSKIMTEKTDDQHFLTMPEIQRLLEEYEVTADRKSLYNDLETLRLLGIDVIGEKDGRNYYYHVGKKQFEIAELKLLVDAIQSSKFITEKKSNDLIKKLTGFASEYEALQLKRQVVVQGRIKTMNESIYYVVDDIHNAITDNKKIRFEYLQWTPEKQLVPKKDQLYEVSPWRLTWDDENYYLIGFDSNEGIRHYRVDKMRNIEITNMRREGREFFKEFDPGAFAKKSFGMFGGKDERVKIMFHRDMVGVMIDRFGKEISIHPAGQPNWFETSVDVVVSEKFFGWMFSLGTKAKIIGPTEVADRYREEINNLAESYKKKA